MSGKATGQRLRGNPFLGRSNRALLDSTAQKATGHGAEVAHAGNFMNLHPGPDARIQPSAQDLQLALDSLEDGVIVWDSEGRLLVANASVARVFDLPPDLVSLASRRVDLMAYMARRGDYGPTDDPARLAQELSDRFATGAVRTLTRPCRTAATYGPTRDRARAAVLS